LFSKFTRFVLIVSLACLAPFSALAADAPWNPPAGPDDLRFRALYRELVEINTTQSVGDCTEAANAMAARMRAAGYPESDVRIIVPPGHPKRGNLVARLEGSDPKAGAILLLAHIDVVEANREDWERDPFTLFEEDGFFYARGASDDKAMAAIFTDNMIRYAEEGYRPEHTLKLALTCGEETPDDYNGVRYLLENERDLIEADFALNENGSGRLDAEGNHIAIAMQAGQKVRQLFQLELTGSGGFSSGPPRDNLIYQLGRALSRIADYDFPANISASSRAYLEGMAPYESGQMAADMRALLNDPPDAAALARVRDADPRLNAMLRSTCVTVKFAGGESETALPMRATATVDCRMVPGENMEDIEAALIRVIDDPGISVTRIGDPALPSPAPPLSEEILGPAREVAGEMWPGVVLVPYQVNGEDDGRFLTPAGIPTYGLSGLFQPPGPSGAHGLNERVPVRSVYESREFLYRVVKMYAGGE
jgi:acetylornithine deacetylase/succinyl-diaminopimelate desuccinylase-like protein